MISLRPTAGPARNLRRDKLQAVTGTYQTPSDGPMFRSPQLARRPRTPAGNGPLFRRSPTIRGFNETVPRLAATQM